MKETKSEARFLYWKIMSVIVAIALLWGLGVQIYNGEISILDPQVTEQVWDQLEIIETNSIDLKEFYNDWGSN